MAYRLARVGMLVAISVVAWLGVAVAVHAKCAALVVDVKAQIRGTVPEGFEAVVYSRPEGTGKPPVLDRETGELAVSLWFDSLKSYSLWRGHNCSRKPKEIGLRVLVGGVEETNVVMLFPEHFVEGADGRWTNKRVVVIEPVPGLGAKAGDGAAQQSVQADEVP